jgi:hypothetical protein
MSSVFPTGLWVSRFSAWAPGEQESPALEFTEPLFRRRLSQISKMTIQVLHDLMPLPDGAKLLFSSFRGELARQLEINRMLIEDEALRPAAFSLSVFNAPPALASMALQLTAGYSAVYTAEGRWDGALLAAAAQTACGGGDGVVLVYADERIPPEYRPLAAEARPFAFAALLTRRPGGIPLAAAPRASPAAFLDYLARERTAHA